MNKTAFVQLHVAILLWGLTGILGKAIDMSEGMIVWYRMLITAIGLLVMFLFGTKFKMPKKKDMLQIALMGFIVAAHWVAFFGAIKVSNVSVALSCLSSIALFTALMEPLFTNKKISIIEVVLGLLAIIGIYIIFSFHKFYGLGIALAVLTAFLGSLFTIVNKKLLLNNSAETITFLEMVYGFLILTLFLPLYFKTTNTVFEIPQGWNLVYLLILGLLCTSFAFTISLYALRHISSFTMNLSVNLEPIYSIILAFIIFDEMKELNSGFFVGTFILLASVIFHSFYLYRKNKKAVKRV
ncbi:MAG: DMT family transporter [Bacteroidia bacterium]|nr:DMT family transporter [Bacteroidia bacterium]NNC85735.1 DMT family transporter [Bacteroidia bacterium]